MTGSSKVTSGSLLHGPAGFLGAAATGAALLDGVGVALAVAEAVAVAVVGGAGGGAG
jgi:hypothetical protein